MTAEEMFQEIQNLLVQNFPMKRPFINNYLVIDSQIHKGRYLIKVKNKIDNAQWKQLLETDILKVK